MNCQSYQGMPSIAAIGGHPIRPVLVGFPIAFLVGALTTDLAFWRTGEHFWALASQWLLAAGVAMGPLAAVAGLTDSLTISRVRSLGAGWVHLLGNAAAMLIALWNLLYRFHGGLSGMVVPFGIVLSAVVVAVFFVTGWLGGELIIRHRVGIMSNTNGSD